MTECPKCGKPMNDFSSQCTWCEQKEELKKSLVGDINGMFFLIANKGDFTDKDVDVLLDVIADKVVGK